MLLWYRFSLKQLEVLRQGGFIIYKNTRPSTVNQTCEWLQHYRWEDMDHPPYSPNLMPSDFHYCGHLKQHLAGKKFATHANMKQGVTFWLQTLHTDFFYRDTSLREKVGKCWNISGDRWKYEVHHPLLMHHQVRIKFSASQCLLSPFLKLIFTKVYMLHKQKPNRSEDILQFVQFTSVCLKNY